MSLLLIRACGVLALALLVGCGQPPSSTPETVSPTPLPSPTRTPTQALPSPTAPAVTVTPAPSLVEILDDVKKAVVMIETPQGNGSGFIFDKRGWVLTNAHVVGHFNRVMVTVESQGLLDRVSVIGQVIRVDDEADLAFVLLESDRTYPELELGDPDQISLGQDVLAIGFPLPDVLGEEISVARGIVSSLRHIGKYDYIQTDAAINPGSSGGPLLDLSGKVIGVNSLNVRRVLGELVEGVGFALSIREIEKLIPSLTLPTDSPGTEGTEE